MFKKILILLFISSLLIFEVFALANDSDGDNVVDDNDLCLDIAGSQDNLGCPIFEDVCKQDSDCDNGYACSKEGICIDEQMSRDSLPAYLQNSSKGLFIGKVVCDNSPCDFNINFNSNLRAGDIVFPAIVSQDGAEIYSKGKLFQIR